MLATLLALLTVGTPAAFHTWQIAYISGKDLWVADGAGEHRRLVAHDANNPCWSPDKKRIAFSRGRELWIVKPDGQGLKLVGSVPKESEVTHVAWGSCGMEGSGHRNLRAASGQSIMLSAEEGVESHIYEATYTSSRTGKLGLVDWVEGGSGFAFSHYAYPAPDRSGNLFAFTVNGDIWLASRVEGESDTRGGWDSWRFLAVAEYDAPTYRADREIHVARHISWSPNNRTIAYEFKREGGSGCEQVWLATIVGKPAPYETKPPTKRVLMDGALNPSFSPDGKWVLVTKMSGSDDWHGLAAVSLDGKRTVRLIKNASQGRW